MKQTFSFMSRCTICWPFHSSVWNPAPAFRKNHVRSIQPDCFDKFRSHWSLALFQWNSFRVHALYLNEGGFFYLNRHGDLSPADGAQKPPPIAASLKPDVYHRTAFRALRIGVTIAVVIFGYELSFRHEGCGVGCCRSRACSQSVSVG